MNVLIKCIVTPCVVFTALVGAILGGYLAFVVSLKAIWKKDYLEKLNKDLGKIKKALKATDKEDILAHDFKACCAKRDLNVNLNSSTSDVKFDTKGFERNYGGRL